MNWLAGESPRQCNHEKFSNEIKQSIIEHAHNNTIDHGKFATTVKNINNENSDNDAVAIAQIKEALINGSAPQFT